MRKYQSRFKGTCEEEVTLTIAAPEWMSESRLALIIEKVAHDMREHLAAEHPGPDPDVD